MKKDKSEENLIALLETFPESKNKVDSPVGKMIADIVSGMREGQLLEDIAKESVFEITLKEGKYLCSLDTEQRLKQVYPL